MYSSTSPSQLHFDLLEYATRFSPQETEMRARIREHTASICPGVEMICGPIVASLIQFLMRLINAKICLDIGTFTGYSAIAMAEALPPDGRIYSYEISKRSFAIAHALIGQSAFVHQIEMICGDARDDLQRFGLNSIDFVFLDADKRHSLEYYERIIDILRPGGMVMIDDVLWEGEVLAPHSYRSQVMHALNERIVHDPRVEQVLLPIRHGIQMVRKK